ncbi:Fe-S cluster assembly sulfur transfer protein SufU [Arthrobacter sp. 35W]|uniref:Fe-S cluster assembly sulfur transfer protein SufU n=1 Tax=Arthrobacter sp. 35W TaxID=1132441 RepID=UPI00054DBF61|nr:SUF system NifU family Fe-S cluster assembly protein [Arthrobacter sp. 35W]
MQPNSAMDAMYQEIILDHAKLRSGSDLSAEEAAETSYDAGCGQVHQLNPVCGDEITLRLSVDGNTVESIHWLGDGCSISMASASILAQEAKGMTVEELRTLIGQFREVMRSRGSMVADEEVLGDAAALGGVSKFPARVKCAMLAWVAAEGALAQASTP